MKRNSLTLRTTTPPTPPW